MTFCDVITKVAASGRLGMLRVLLLVYDTITLTIPNLQNSTITLTIKTNRNAVIFCIELKVERVRMKVSNMSF